MGGVPAGGTVRGGFRFAHRIATDRPFRDELHARLTGAKTSAPLFDAAAFTRNLERVYLDLAAQS